MTKFIVMSCMQFSSAHGWIDTCAPYKVRCDAIIFEYADHEFEVKYLLEIGDKKHLEILEKARKSRREFTSKISDVCYYWLPK